MARTSKASPPAFVFTAGGDMGHAAPADAALAKMAGSGADFSLHLGDFSYDRFAPESVWCDYVKAAMGAGFAYELVAGGHDVGSTPGEGTIDNYAACLPDHMGSTGTYGREYFFDHPAVGPLARVIMISPSITFPGKQTYDYSAGTAHYQWVADAIDGARAAGIPWVIVGMARNCVTAGQKPCEIGTDLFNLLVDRRVDLVLQGHEHGYERSKQLGTSPACPAVPINAYNAACVTDDGADGSYTKGSGPIVVISGTLGVGLRPMYPKDPEAPDFATLMGQKTNATNGFVKYTVSTTEIRAEFVASSGGTFADSFTITDPTPEPPPSSPPPTTPPTSTPPATPPGSPAGTPAGTSAGYWTLEADGTVHPFGTAGSFGDAAARLQPGTPAVDLERTPSGQGYWILDRAGRVFAFGDAPRLGPDKTLPMAAGETAASLSATPSGKGYWVVTNRGRVLPYGDAPFLGDISALRLAGPVLDSVATPTGAGYFLMASDGGIFALGDASFAGSMGGQRLNAPVQALVPDGDGSGYWLVASDGGVFAFHADYRGSMGGIALNRPVVGMVRYGNGYLMVAQDGGIFNFGDRPFAGSLGGHPVGQPVVGVAALG